MQKLIQSLNDYHAPDDFTRDEWKQVTLALFGAYFRRPTRLRKNIDAFMLELRNLARFFNHPEHLALMQWCLALHRRVLSTDRAGAYSTLHHLFNNMGASDERWLNLFQTTNSLGSNASPRDRAFQLFETIGGVAEGCFKPNLQIIYAFAVRDVSGVWPQEVKSLDFGALVAGFPSSLSARYPLLLKDPDLNISVNQWRNISAHKSYRLVGPRTVEISFGKGKLQTNKFGLRRLSDVSRWLLKTHHAVRLANTIIFVEHMSDILALGQQITERSFSSTMLRVGHDLSTVGYEVVDWKERKREAVLIVRDRLNRDPYDALVHASQQLVNLSIGILADVSTRSRIAKISIQLLMPNGKTYGMARVAVSDADAYSLRKINLREYMKRIEWYCIDQFVSA